MTTGKTIALTIWTFVGKVISLLFNMVSRASLVAQMVKTSTCNAGDPSSIPGLGRSSEEGRGYPVQYSDLENSWTEEPGRLQPMGSQSLEMTE